MSEVVTATGGAVIAGVADGVFVGGALDSRRIEGGELFFALDGEHADGHDFVASALERGAGGAVVERSIELPEDTAGVLIQVDDAREALWALTRHLRRRLPRHLVAITGSAGKTTTKELLAAMLSQRFVTGASPGNFNNLYGFPLALMSLDDDTEWMVAEMGMSTPGELGGVSRLGRPEAAIFTNVRAAHLEAFDREGASATVRSIGDAKAELLEGLDPGGLVIANALDPEVIRIAERHQDGGGRVVWFALRPEEASFAPRLRIGALRSPTPVTTADTPLWGSTFELTDTAQGTDRANTPARPTVVELPLYGTVNVENFLAAATAAIELGVSLQEIAAAASEVAPVAGRGRTLAIGDDVLLVDDSYNSNPSALEQALRAAARLPGERHWAILGDMLELGASTDAMHRDAGREAAALGFSPVVGVGEHCRELIAAAEDGGSETHWFADAGDAAAWAQGELRSGDVVLIKGSRGIALEQVVSALADAGEDG